MTTAGPLPHEPGACRRGWVRTTATNLAKTECLRLFSNPSPEVLALLDRLDESTRLQFP